MSIFKYQLTNQDGQSQKRVLFLNPDEVRAKLAKGWQITKIWKHTNEDDFDLIDASILDISHSRSFVGRPILLLQNWQRLASYITEYTRFYFDNQKNLEKYKNRLLTNCIYLEHDGALMDTETKDLIVSKLICINFSQKNFVVYKD